jgi:hypothetical protein
MPTMVPASVGVILASLLGLWTRLIDSQQALVQEHAVHRSDSLLSVLRFCHLYEGNPRTWSASRSLTIVTVSTAP